jgi:Zn-dependent protease
MQWFAFTFALAAISIGLSVTIDRFGPLPDTIRYAAIAGGVIIIGLWMRASLRFHGSLDEMQRRIFLEATSIVGIAAIAWAYLFPVLEKTGVTGPIDHDVYAIAVLPLTAAAIAVTLRRYR